MKKKNEETKQGIENFEIKDFFFSSFPLPFSHFFLKKKKKFSSRMNINML